MILPFYCKTNDNESLIIDHAKQIDAEAIIKFLNAVGGETNFLTFGKNEFHVSIEEEKELITECLEKQKKLMLVAKIRKNIVGQLFMDRSAKARLEHIGNFGISIAKPYWGKGIAEKMLEILIKWASLGGIARLELQVLTENERAISLYKKFGFEIEGTIRRAHKITNNFYDAHIMSLLL